MSGQQYSIHVAAPAAFSKMKQAIENIKEIDGSEADIRVTGWDYSFSSLSHWASSRKESEPDIVIMFDTAEYPKVSEKTGGRLFYSGMISCIREVRLNLGSKLVLILASDKENNLEFLNELMKINVHNFYFTPEQFTVDDLKRWLFSPERTLKDNEKYIIAGDGMARTKVIHEKEYIDHGRKDKTSKHGRESGNNEVHKPVKEKIVTVERIVKEVVPVPFRKLVLCVLDNLEFACELGYLASRLTSHRVLIVELDALGSRMDIYLDLGGLQFASGETKGFPAYSELIGKGMPSAGVFDKACIRCRDSPNLHVINNLVDQFINSTTDKAEIDKKSEDSKNIDPGVFIDNAYRNFDITLITLTRNISMSAVQTCIERSDYNIWAVSANMDSLRDCGTRIEYYCDSLNLPLQKNLLVAYEYKKGVNYPVNYLKNIYYPDCLLGVVSYCEEREYYRNLDRSYASKMAEGDTGEYIRILSRLNIVPEKSRLESFGDLLRRLVYNVRKRNIQKPNFNENINQSEGKNRMEGTIDEQKDCV